MKVADFTAEEFREFVKDSVREALQELLFDPDEGLELKTALEQRLLASARSTEPTLKLEDVAKELGLAL
jgi:hypothetical protein